MDRGLPRIAVAFAWSVTTRSRHRASMFIHCQTPFTNSPLEGPPRRRPPLKPDMVAVRGNAQRAKQHSQCRWRCWLCASRGLVTDVGCGWEHCRWSKLTSARSQTLELLRSVGTHWRIHSIRSRIAPGAKDAPAAVFASNVSILARHSSRSVVTVAVAVGSGTRPWNPLASTRSAESGILVSTHRLIPPVLALFLIPAPSHTWHSEYDQQRACRLWRCNAAVPLSIHSLAGGYPIVLPQCSSGRSGGFHHRCSCSLSSWSFLDGSSAKVRATRLLPRLPHLLLR